MEVVISKIDGGYLIECRYEGRYKQYLKVVLRDALQLAEDLFKHNHEFTEDK